MPQLLTQAPQVFGHFLQELRWTFGDIQMLLVVIAVLVFLGFVFHWYFGVIHDKFYAQLQEWEGELEKREQRIVAEEELREKERAVEWAKRFPECAGLSRDALVLKLPNTTNPLFVDALFAALNPTAPAASEPAQTPAKSVKVKPVLQPA